MMRTEVERAVLAQKSSASSKKPLWALVMDVCPMTRNGLRHMLKASLFKTGDVMTLNKASDVPACLALHSPDVIVMELCGEGESVLEGLRVIATCVQRWPLTPLVLCTVLTDVRFLHQIKSLGVYSICHKHDPLATIERCIGFSLAGSYQDSPTIQRLLLGNNCTLPALTGREIDVLDYLLSGSSVSGTALTMHRDIRTISTHKRNAMAKLGYKNDGELFSRGMWMSRNGFFNE